MTYAQKDRSVQDGQPVEFFKFTGPFGTFRYTSDNEPGVCEGELYSVIPGGVTRTTIEVTSVADSAVTMDFALPADSPVPQLYCFKRTPELMTVEVRSAHRGDDWNTEFMIEWIGYGLETSVRGDFATIRTGSIIQTRLQGNVANVYYQRMCNHILGDERCKVDLGDWTLTATITKVQNQIITVDNDGTGNTELKAGEIVNVRTGERRGIYNNVDNRISVSYPFIDLVVGDEVNLIFGCDHRRLGDCKLRYNNVINYGGTDFTPITNPFDNFNLQTKIVETIKQDRYKDIQVVLPTGGSV